MGRYKVALVAHAGKEVPAWVVQALNGEGIDFTIHGSNVAKVEISAK